MFIFFAFGLLFFKWTWEFNMWLVFVIISIKTHYILVKSWHHIVVYSGIRHTITNKINMIGAGKVRCLGMCETSRLNTTVAVKQHCKYKVHTFFHKYIYIYIYIYQCYPAGVGNMKHSSEILVHIDMIASADLSDTHPWCKSPVPPHPKSALLDWDLVTVEAIWVKWTHCHVQESSLRWF